MKVKTSIFILFPFVSCLLLCACGQRASSAGEAKADAPAWGMKWAGKGSSSHADMTVAVMPMWDCLPLAVAYDRGFFEKKGIKVNLKFYDSQMDCDNALRGGGVNAGVTDIVRADRLQRQGVALTYITATETQWKLIANKNARLKTTSQLGDKMVAMARYSATDLFTTLMLNEGKPKNTVFRLQVNSLHTRLKMILCNAMDAAWLPEPQATQAIRAGHNILPVKAIEDLRMGTIVMKTDSTPTIDNSGKVNNFIMAYNQAVDSINHYGAEKYAETVSRLCNVDKTTLKALNKYRFTHARQPRQCDLEKAQTKF